MFGQGLPTAAPGSAEGGLIVSDIDAAHDELVDRRIEVSDIWNGPPFPVEARQPGPDPERTSYGSFFYFTDPDSNTWLVQEVTTRLPGRMNAAETAVCVRSGPGERASTCRGRPTSASVRIHCTGPASADRRPASAGPESPRSSCGNILGRALLVSSGPVLPTVAPIPCWQHRPVRTNERSSATNSFSPADEGACPIPKRRIWSFATRT